MKQVVLLLTLLTLYGCQPGGVTDFDGDGASDQVDCDPADPEVYPGAPDPLGDGIDQDCDGADGSGGLDNVDDDGDDGEYFLGIEGKAFEFAQADCDVSFLECSVAKQGGLDALRAAISDALAA